MLLQILPRGLWNYGAGMFIPILWDKPGEQRKMLFPFQCIHNEKIITSLRVDEGAGWEFIFVCRQKRDGPDHVSSVAQSWEEMCWLNERIFFHGASPANRGTSHSSQVVIRGTDGDAAECSPCWPHRRCFPSSCLYLQQKWEMRGKVRQGANKNRGAKYTFVICRTPIAALLCGRL